MRLANGRAERRLRDRLREEPRRAVRERFGILRVINNGRVNKSQFIS